MLDILFILAEYLYINKTENDPTTGSNSNQKSYQRETESTGSDQETYRKTS